jgi:hypothetical protein
MKSEGNPGLNWLSRGFTGEYFLSLGINVLYPHRKIAKINVGTKVGSFMGFQKSSTLAVCVSLLVMGVTVSVFSKDNPFGKFNQEDKFRQLEEALPTPNSYRTASGAPGHRYWQQKADYKIDVKLDDDKQRIIGSEAITYQNNSPDTLRYLWLQLDANIFAPDSDAVKVAQAPGFDKVPFRTLRRMLVRESFDGGCKITAVKDAKGKNLKYTIVKTMMRIDLPKVLKSRQKVKFSIDWNYNINHSKMVGGRTGCEYFEKDGNYIYEIAQWFPRMVAYTDVNGWQHKQFLGRGEFTLEFGDYLVSITAPADHVVASTGVLQNPKAVLTKVQMARFKASKTAKTPQFIITPKEALANEKSRSKKNKTWTFKAKKVRDFAFASSRKFIWDAQGLKQGGKRTIMAMSYYPNEGEPLWSRYSTHSIIHTINIYSRYTFDYPYPVAISVNGPVGGMEYPMLCFNGPRPEKDGTYSARTKYGLISVIIHEVGHNYFPMIVNSDERQWTWMDEGLNTFVQVLAEAEWEENYPSRRGEPQSIVNYMKSSSQVPIMTNSESILQFGSNAYAKPATALNILRESILGRELFDFAFKEYARRWKFKRPQPADFFRTMEDASGVDLDWFWRGWFYSTNHCDLSIENVRIYTVDAPNPGLSKQKSREERDKRPETLSKKRNKALAKRADAYPDLKDFYNHYDKLNVTEGDRRAFDKFWKSLKAEDKALYKLKRHFTVVSLRNVGGLVMPVILQAEFADGTKQEFRIPAEIWRQNAEKATKLLITTKEVKSITLDPHLETADTDLANNHFPPRPAISRFKLFKQKRRWGGGGNPMKEAKKEAQRKAKARKKEPIKGPTPKKIAKKKATKKAGQRPSKKRAF